MKTDPRPCNLKGQKKVVIQELTNSIIVKKEFLSDEVEAQIENVKDSKGQTNALIQESTNNIEKLNNEKEIHHDLCNYNWVIFETLCYGSLNDAFKDYLHQGADE